MPEFHDAHPQLLKWKEKVLNRQIDLEEIRYRGLLGERYGGNMKNIDTIKMQAVE